MRFIVFGSTSSAKLRYRDTEIVDKVMAARSLWETCPGPLGPLLRAVRVFIGDVCVGFVYVMKERCFIAVVLPQRVLHKIK